MLPACPGDWMRGLPPSATCLENVELQLWSHTNHTSLLQLLRHKAVETFLWLRFHQQLPDQVQGGDRFTYHQSFQPLPMASLQVPPGKDPGDLPWHELPLVPMQESTCVGTACGC